jgi:arylsulfatase
MIWGFIIRTTSFVILASLLSLFGGCEQIEEGSPLPNIILISADDLGWSDLGCYGSEIQTPNLDRLAYDGIRFTRFYNTSKCFPSRACLLTGVYAQDCGYERTHMNPISHAVTIGEVLRSAGYLTYWSGKHHGLENPVTRGFDRYYGLKDGACNHFNPGNQRPGEVEPARKNRVREWCFDAQILKPYTPEEKDFYTTDYFTNMALSFLDDGMASEAPFFLYLAYTAPHDPLMAWPEDIEKYKGMYDEGFGSIRKKRYLHQLSQGLIDSSYILPEPSHSQWVGLSENEQLFEAQKMEVYAAMIDRMDFNIGRIISALKEKGELENTLILFVSDNGASAELVDLDIDDDTAPVGSMGRWVSLGADWANVSNTPFRYYKNYSFEGGINSPLIVHWPDGHIENGISTYPGHFIDIMATLVDITGANYPSQKDKEPIVPMRGHSLLPALKGHSIQRSQPLFWQWQRGGAVRSGPWKLVKHADLPDWELYNIENDPTETNDLSGKNPEIVEKLASVHDNWLKSYDGKIE